MKLKKLIMMGVLSAMVTGCLSACGKPISKPKKGDAVASTLNTAELTTAQKLLETGVCTSVPTTHPSVLGFTTYLNVNDIDVDGFYRQNEIHFEGKNYSTVSGIVTFRGDNYRSSGSFGVANMTSYKMYKTWNINTGSLKKTVKKGEWTGSGWTGQPLIVQWDDETKKAMNLYDSKKNKTGLVEVIYATMDGNIYFLDLEDGSATRDKISLGFPIKGTGSIYPDGTPLYVVGAGDDMGKKAARTFIVSLVTGDVIMEYGNDDPFSRRTDNGNFCAFDSSPLFDVKTDTLIQPGENGILYTTKLNTSWDGRTLTINPSERVKWTYETSRSGKDKYWLGMESSACIYDHYLYVCDNAGDLMCIDINTMELIWSQDIVDDSNASPVLEVDPSTGTAYIYVSTSLHWTQNKKKTGDIPIFKINAATGEIMWKRTYSCKTVDGISGGVQATACLGENNLSGMVYFNIARTGGKKHGLLVAIDKKTGGEVWSVEMKYYSWSSPVAVYNSNGDGYIILCDSDGNMHLLDGKTGKVKDTINLGKNIEATPAVFNNMIVVGTRGKKIYGITLK